VIDPIFGQVIDYGTTSYRPPTHLADLVIARDGTCAFPPCNRPARSCDLDHEVPYPHGDTSAENLGSKCRRDHRLKHHAGWTVRRNQDGTISTSPQGREYTNDPPHAGKCPGSKTGVLTCGEADPSYVSLSDLDVSDQIGGHDYLAATLIAERQLTIDALQRGRHESFDFGGRL